MPQPDPNIIPLPVQTASAWSKTWARTRHSNLVRYRGSGVFYAYATVRGERVHKSLKTKSEQIALVRLSDLLATERQKVSVSGVDTFKGVADSWLEQSQSDPERKPSSKRYDRETLKAIRANWPQLDQLPLSKLSPALFEAWAVKFKAKYSATRFNGALTTLNSIFDRAKRQGLLGSNPVQGIQRASVKVKPLVMPSRSEFKAVLKRLDSRPDRANAAMMVRLLAYAGPRISAARELYPANVDLKRNELILPPVKYQAEPIRLPIFPQLRPVLVKLLKQYPGSGPLLQIKNPRKALKTACREAGVPYLTPHKLRHYFSTVCIEAGVEARTVAAWRGDKDGGKMLLARYAHSRDEHSQRMSKKVRF